MSSNHSISENTPHLLVLGMGGTIAGLAPNPKETPLQYEAGQVGVDVLVAQVQSVVPKGIKLVSRQLANINSRNLTDAHLTSLGLAVREALLDVAVSGIVITHGTDTIEETGLFLQVTCGKLAQTQSKRVILTGAMLPSNAPGADGPSNLLDALRWASTPIDNCPGGIYAVMDGRGCMAIDLAKRHATALNAPLQNSPSSSVSLINPSWLSGVRAIQAAWNEDLPIPQEGEWPWVEILTSHAGARSETITHWLGSAVQGFVLAGSGQGGFHDDWVKPLDQAMVQGIALVRTTRTGAGATLHNIPEADAPGCCASGALTAPRARIALQLALNAAKQANKAGKPLTWQDFFARIANLPEIQ
ncbi:asparaginase domain-containing protein [Polynucleobacter sp. AP-Sving-400A-A2]|uniref:asparaginase domain-containing protein n=1 Tax=Polynucleobacter sp. AP-Sving-400A-A2 TaxID=2081049 RepID=UPI001BFD0488|nr:asparaginase domain-containing protein [Polynucleobacter sp. AP-Sving-400A-A2]QWE14054.1 asparaginase [Polynucleobacter sp. AP-Sving-400A-A2]